MLLSPLLALAPLIASAAHTSASAAVTSTFEVAPDQGCVLAVFYKVTTKNSTSPAELQVTPRSAWSVCGHGSGAAQGGGKHRSLSWTWPYEDAATVPVVVYSGMAPFNDATKKLSDFPLCVFGPKRWDIINGTARIAMEDQALRSDGGYTWFSSDALYNATIPKEGDPVVLQKYRECHARGDKSRLDSAIFANNDHLLSLLPNPYGPKFQDSIGYYNLNLNNEPVTIQLASATSGPLQVKRTAVAEGAASAMATRATLRKRFRSSEASFV